MAGDAFLLNYGQKGQRVLKLISDPTEVSHFPSSQFQGIDTIDPRYAERNVAVSHVNRLLQTDVIPETHLASHQGQIGYSMTKAQGSSPRTKHGDENFSRPNHEALNRASKQHTGHSHWTQNPVTQQGLMDLQANDYITNAAWDRNSTNYIVDPKTGRVQGIDNDFSLGTTSQERIPEHIRSKVSFGQGLPPMMHSKTAARIKHIAKNPDLLRAQLQEHIGPSEVEAAVQRLRNLHKHIGYLEENGCVVDRFDQATHQHIMSQAEEGSYLRRDAYA